MIWTEEALAYCPRKLAGNVPFVEWMAERLGSGLMVDCGANVGAVCVATLKGCSGARAVAFEPQTRAADVLVELAAVNGVDVTLYREALGREPGEALLKYPVDRSISGWASIAPKPDFYEAKNAKVESASEWVDVTTLDAWWTEAGRPDVQLVKIDCQGAEVDILAGGAEMFAATVPYLFIEIHGPTLAEHGHTKGDLRDALRQLGFEFERANRINLYCWREI